MDGSKTYGVADFGIIYSPDFIQAGYGGQVDLTDCVVQLKDGDEKFKNQASSKWRKPGRETV